MNEERIKIIKETLKRIRSKLGSSVYSTDDPETCPKEVEEDLGLNTRWLCEDCLSIFKIDEHADCPCCVLPFDEVRKYALKEVRRLLRK